MKKWRVKQLGEVASVIRGVSFDKTKVYDFAGTNTVPILRAGNIQESLLTDSDLVYVPRELVSEEQLMRYGDLAICMSSGSASIVGKTAHLTKEWTGSVGAFCAIIRYTSTLHHRFGSYWFRSPDFRQWRNCNAKGANIQNLRLAELMKVPIPVPPLAEQERIVKLLDEADELRKLRAQADTRTANLIPALFNEMFGDPATNPKGWAVSPVSSFVQELQGGRNVNPAGADETVGGYRVLKVSAVTWGEYLPNESKPLPAAYNPPQSHIVRAGDLLFSRANTVELVGATSYVFETPQNLLLPDKLWRLIWKEPIAVDPLFVWWLLQCKSVRIALANRATGTGGSMKNISKPKLMSLLVPLPPLPLQQQFAQRVTEIREMESSQSASRQRLENLFQSVLHAAFNGEL